MYSAEKTDAISFQTKRRGLMEKRKLEKLGIETSLLGFGCMRFPTTPDGKIDEA